MGKFLLVLALLCAPAYAGVCTSSQYDMLEWTTMSSASTFIQGNANPLYTVFDQWHQRYYWIKSSSGYPWDVNTCNTYYIYQWITEQNWNNPQTYKNFEHPLPWMPRCINVPTAPGKLSTVTVPNSRTNFDIHSSCSQYTVHNLGYVVNEIWGPYNMSLGGDLPSNTPTLELSYRYSCDANYNNCSDKETFDFQKHFGLVQWKHYQWQNGAWNQVNQTVFNTLHTGTAVPVHPCWN